MTERPRYSADFAKGFATGVRAAIERPGDARRATEWKLRSITLYPDKVWSLVSIIGSVILLFGVTRGSQGFAFFGFVVMLIGITARC